jgi:repressor LexA
MTKTHVSDISLYLNDVGLLKEMPASVRRMAEFLVAIVDAVTRKCPTIGYPTGVPCRKRGCKGSVLGSLQLADGRITSWCLLCQQHGVISGWQGMKWDHTATCSTAEKPLPAYTHKEGQYLAFIYYYTKLNRQAPSEIDTREYFRVTPPAVHDMVLKLEKHGFIGREPGVPRSIRLLLKREELPDLE